MDAAIAAPRDDVRDTAPKIVSFEIPIDKIGEVIGPKGKVINTIQQETGADISVQDDDGMVGIVSIGSKDGAAVAEARRRIELILDPPTAEVGAIYTGRVVNITKFGAFVNILPGRDGLVHISKLGRGKRIDRVEDVLSLGDELEVKVDDIDQNGKLSLSLVGDDGDGGGGGGGGGDRAGRRATGAATAVSAATAVTAARAVERPSGGARDRVVRGVLGRAGQRGVRRPRSGRRAGRRRAPRRRRSRRRPRWPRRRRSRPGGGAPWRGRR